MTAALTPPGAPHAFRAALQQRRQRLAESLSTPAVLWSGTAPPRNFPANRYPFRASSHFLYFAGLPLENAAIRLEGGQLELFVDEPSPESTLWHGNRPGRDEIAGWMGAKAAYPLADLAERSAGAATLAVQDPKTYQQQCHRLGRPVGPSNAPEGIDGALARAIVSLRLRHDSLALEQLRQAAAVAVAAHQAGMRATLKAQWEAEVRAAMEAAIAARQMSCAYPSIVTVGGEVLHGEQSHHPLREGDLLLADVGAETPLGWASDITRTWPVGGKFSPAQRDIYELVLAAHDACIERVAPGVEYRDIHLLAASILAEGLVDLGILRGNPADLVERDAQALFFPHGIGHLLGLDVHDMEDLGDLAGYAPGRSRSHRLGLRYLRLNRPLEPGMAVTIEPGFYQVPSLLNHPDCRSQYREAVNWERLEEFAAVRGIRIEDEVLVTESGSEVLTAKLPNRAADIETLMR